MRHLLAFLFTLVLLTHSSHLRAQDVHSFIENYKSTYEKYIKKGQFDPTLTYVPTIMNLEEIDSWSDLSLQERQKNLLNYISRPILENDFALDVKKGEYYDFPNAWLYRELPRERVNLLAGPYSLPYREKRLMKYLHNNRVDYIFRITYCGVDLGLDFDIRYWVITDNQLQILLYDKDNDELYPVEAVEFINENIELFKHPLDTL